MKTPEGVTLRGCGCSEALNTMQSPASGVTTPSEKSCIGLKYQCADCSAVLFVEFEPVRQRTDVVLSKHYKAEHPELANQLGGHHNVEYVGFGAPDWGTEGDV